jgi:phosphohistidine swiveling domain-containing protein
VNGLDEFNHHDWLLWEQPASPFLLGLAFDASRRPLEAVAGTEWPTTVLYYSRGTVQWLNRWADLRCLGQRIVDLLLIPEYSSRYWYLIGAAEMRLLNACAIQSELKACDANHAVAMIREVERAYSAWYAMAWFCEPVEFHVQDVLGEWLNRVGSAEDAASIMLDLAATSDESISTAITRDMHSCLLAAKRGREVQDDGPLEAAVRQHVQRFHWQFNNYLGARPLVVQGVLDELHALSDSDLSSRTLALEEELESSRLSLLEGPGRRERALHELPPHLRSVGELLWAFGGTLKDRRKRVVMEANGVFDGLLADVASHVQTPLNLVRQLLPGELEYFVERSSWYRERLRLRETGLLVYQAEQHLVLEGFDTEISGTGLGRPMRQPFVAEGELASVYMDRINRVLGFNEVPVSEDLSDELRGTVAFRGDAPRLSGVARVVRDPKLEPFTRGEILLAPSTTPDYLPCIRACSAIVTDWGGITSHAAICAREFRKPCLIGTNGATRRFKTGDVIEIDLERGTVSLAKGRQQ